MDLTQEQQTIGLMIDQMNAAAIDCTKTLAEAQDAILAGQQNSAIGALLGIEQQIDLLKTLYGAALAVHRIR